MGEPQKFRNVIELHCKLRSPKTSQPRGPGARTKIMNTLDTLEQRELASFYLRRFNAKDKQSVATHKHNISVIQSKIDDGEKCEEELERAIIKFHAEYRFDFQRWRSALLCNMDDCKDRCRGFNYGSIILQIPTRELRKVA